MKKIVHQFTKRERKQQKVNREKAAAANKMRHDLKVDGPNMQVLGPSNLFDELYSKYTANSRGKGKVMQIYESVFCKG